MNVDDLATGGESIRKVDKIKGNSVKLFQRGGFNLHKWHSNEQALETNDSVNENDLNFVKQQLGTKPKETKILWYKREDSFIIQVPNANKYPAKRNILNTLASIYDPLGFMSPCLLLGKIIYRNLCDLKVSWYNEISIDIKIRWLKWIAGLRTET